MRFRTLVAMLLLEILPFTAMAQQARKADGEKLVAPSLVFASAPADTKLLSAVLEVNPTLPLGPEYVLHGYESDMTLVGQRMSSELANIARAFHSGRITRAEAEYLIQENYQVALMQYEVFSALHDALAEDIARVAARAKIPPSSGSDTAAVVYDPAAVSASRIP
jgi:hypothetical protein